MHTRKQLGSKGIIFELSLEGIPLYEEIYLASNIPPLESRDPPLLGKGPGGRLSCCLRRKWRAPFSGCFLQRDEERDFFSQTSSKRDSSGSALSLCSLCEDWRTDSFFQGIFYARAFDVFPLIHLLLELYLYIRSPVLYISQFELHEGNFVFGRIWDFWVDNKWRGNPYLLVFFFCKYKRVLWKFHSISREFPIRV